MKATLTLPQIEQRIQTIKSQLAALGEMRPGSLSRQYNVCGKPGCRCKDPQHPQRHGPYYQLSWVHRGKSTSQFIRRPWVPQVKAQLATYKTFRRLTEQWVALALQAAQRRLQAAKDAAAPARSTPSSHQG
jgi:hypothetical protein